VRAWRLYGTGLSRWLRRPRAEVDISGVDRTAYAHRRAVKSINSKQFSEFRTSGMQPVKPEYVAGGVCVWYCNVVVICSFLSVDCNESRSKTNRSSYELLCKGDSQLQLRWTPPVHTTLPFCHVARDSAPSGACSRALVATRSSCPAVRSLSYRPLLSAGMRGQR
jgi:hypothetical protein